MFVFVDESGDTGFKLDRGSSRYFVIVLLIFKDQSESEAISKKIQKFRKDFKVSSYYEFKFNKTNKLLKVELFKVVSRGRFKVRALILDKRRLKIYPKAKFQGSVYNYILKQLLVDSLGKEKDIRVRLDGSASSELRKSVNSSFRKSFKGSGKRLEIKMVNSKSDSLIQLADLIAGSIRRSYELEKGDRSLYKDLIKGKIEDEKIMKEIDLVPILE